MQYGSAHVSSPYTVPAASETQLTDGAQKVWDLGLRTIKLYCTQFYGDSDYPWETWSATPATCTGLLQTTEFQTVLAMGWNTVILTIFPFSNPATNWWRTGVAVGDLGNEYTEIYNAAVHLLTAYNGSGKTFIFQNWEGDWAFMDSFDPATPIPRQQIDNFAAFLSTRQRAVSDARRNTAHAGVTVLNAIEVNRVLDTVNNPGRRRIVTDILPRVQPDCVSYSAYDSTIVETGWGKDLEHWQADCRTLFTKALRIIKAAAPGARLYIGEFGFPENEAINDIGRTGSEIQAMIQTVADVAKAEGATHLLFWEVFDNEVSIPYGYRGFWLIRPDGSTSYSGTKMAALAAGG